MQDIPYSRQKIDSDDVNEIQKTLLSDFITQGPKIQEFEEQIANYCGAKYAVVVANGTAALHLAALAAGLKPGDQTITTPISFLATSNCIVYAGAMPVFADVDYETVNLDPEQVKKLVNKKTKAVLPVDFAGLPADMSEIRKITNRYGLTVIEDASHALGGRYASNDKVGSCQFSDMTIFSFHPVKHITTGEGGCITTNDKKLYQQLQALRNHGVYKEDRTLLKKGGWYYEMKDLGFNYRITDIQCTLGISQLKKIDSFIAKRSGIAERYNQAFQEIQDLVRVPPQTVESKKHVWHLYLLRLKVNPPGKIRRALYEHLKANGINAQVHYIPIYYQPFYRQLLNREVKRCPNAEKYYEEVLSLPIFPELGESEFEKIVSTVKTFLKNHT